MTNSTPNSAPFPQQPTGGPIVPSIMVQPSPALPAPVNTPPVRKLTYTLRNERREKVKEFLDKGITNQTKIAALIGVTTDTIRKDIKEINKLRKVALTKEAASDHVGTMLGQMEEIVKNATMDYMSISGNDVKSTTAKASLLQTSLRAVMAKAQLLMQTGVVPADITVLDKVLEAQAMEVKAKQSFDPQLAEVVANADSRRKVIDLVDRLKGISPDVASAVMDRLDAKIKEDDARAPAAPVEGPQAPISPAEQSPTPQAGA